MAGNFAGTKNPIRLVDPLSLCFDNGIDDISISTAAFISCAADSSMLRWQPSHHHKCIHPQRTILQANKLFGVTHHEIELGKGGHTRQEDAYDKVHHQKEEY